MATKKRRLTKKSGAKRSKRIPNLSNKIPSGFALPLGSKISAVRQQSLIDQGMELLTEDLKFQDLVVSKGYRNRKITTSNAVKGKIEEEAINLYNHSTGLLNKMSLTYAKAGGLAVDLETGKSVTPKKLPTFKQLQAMEVKFGHDPLMMMGLPIPLAVMNNRTLAFKIAALLQIEEVAALFLAWLNATFPNFLAGIGAALRAGRLHVVRLLLTQLLEALVSGSFFTFLSQRMSAAAARRIIAKIAAKAVPGFGWAFLIVGIVAGLVAQVIRRD